MNLFYCLKVFVIVLVVLILAFQILLRPQLIYNKYRRLGRERPELGLTVSSRPAPLIGDLFRFRDDLLLRTSSEIATFGKVRLLFFGVRPAFMVCDPELAQYVLAESKELLLQNDLTRTLIEPMAGKVVGSLNGLAHRQHRALVSPLFRSSLMPKYADLMMTCIRQDALLSDMIGREMDFHELFRHWAFSVISQGVLGCQVEPDFAQKFNEMMSLAQKYSQSPLVLAPNLKWLEIVLRLRLRSLRNRLRAYLEDKITERLETLNPIILNNARIDDPATIPMIDAQLRFEDSHQRRLSLEQIRDEVMMMIVGGKDTVAGMTAWIMSVFYTQPQIEQQCRIEVQHARAISSSPETFPTHADLENLPYLHAVVLESLRLYPAAAGFGRTASRDFDLFGIPISAGHMVFVGSRSLARHPAYWTNPDQFDPNRFLKDGRVRAEQRPEGVPSEAYLPFSGKYRECPGRHLALTEIRIFLSFLLANFQFEFRPGQRFDMDKESLISVPKDGVWGRLIPLN